MAKQQQQNEKNAINKDYDLNLNLNLGLFNPNNGHIIIMQDDLKRKVPSPNGDVFQNYHSNSNAGENSSQSSHSLVHLPDATEPSSDPFENQPVSSEEEAHPNYYNHSECSRNVTSTGINLQPWKSQSDNNKRALDKGSSPTPPRSSNLKSPKVVIGKPPKPNRQMSQKSVLLPQMPSVSTNGPNGKTITGFLYKYSKTEVSIICVCHGTSFSPAGFVEHAGGVDVEHPLKHIRVVPFALS